MLRQRFFILFLCLVITSAIVGPVESANPKSKQSPRMYPVLGYQIPLHDLEEVPEDEEQAIADTNAIVGEFFRKTYANPHTDTGSGLTFAGTRRGVHPKAHGCLVGRMKVSKHLFRSDRVGIFKEPSREYNVFVRFSNGSPRPNANDSDPDSRGFGLKVIDVPGENMLKNVVGSGQVTTQEFTMNSSDAFFADTAERYRDFMRIALLETDSFSNAATEHVISLFKSFHPFLALRVKSAFERIRDVALKTTNPLSLQYFSITPFQHGVGPSAPIVKYSLRPCNGIWEDPVNIANPNFLRENLRDHIAKNPACFQFLVQSRATHSFEIEDPTQPWDQSLAPFREVARIELPAQSLVDERECEDSVINPWNTLPEHQPVGGINRLRLSAYITSILSRQGR